MKKGSSTQGAPVKFRALIQQSGKTAAGIQVPDEVVQALGGGKHPPVRATLAQAGKGGGYTYRSSVASLGGIFMLGVSAQVRQDSGLSGGDEVDVTLELDTEPRQVELPTDFAAALAKDLQARQFFDGLSYSNKRRFVMPIDEAKSPETRQRRIDKALEKLHAGQL
jgi:hypothetical protein